MQRDPERYMQQKIAHRTERQTDSDSEGAETKRQQKRGRQSLLFGAQQLYPENDTLSKATDLAGVAHDILFQFRLEHAAVCNDLEKRRLVDGKRANAFEGRRLRLVAATGGPSGSETEEDTVR